MITGRSLVIISWVCLVHDGSVPHGSFWTRPRMSPHRCSGRTTSEPEVHEPVREGTAPRLVCQGKLKIVIDNFIGSKEFDRVSSEWNNITHDSIRT